MFNYNRLKMRIKIWWLNMFSEHKLIPRFDRKIKNNYIIEDTKEVEIFKLEDFYE